jgi:hypothetical protein
VLAAEIAFRCLRGNVPEKELDLIQFSTTCMAQLRARTPHHAPLLGQARVSKYCFTACQTTRSVTPSPQCFPARQTHRNSLPGEIPAAAAQTSMVLLTHSGTGTVRMWAPLPTRTTMAHCSPRCCKCVKSRSANSLLAESAAQQHARIARSHFPLSMLGAGNCQMRRASSAVSQLPSLTTGLLWRLSHARYKRRVRD